MSMNTSEEVTLLIYQELLDAHGRLMRTHAAMVQRAVTVLESYAALILSPSDDAARDFADALDALRATLDMDVH
jgi:hypothetical protein